MLLAVVPSSPSASAVKVMKEQQPSLSDPLPSLGAGKILFITS